MSEKPKRLHKATYARDKKKGGWMVRIIGPNATRFAGRKVPVTMNNGDEHEEELMVLVWSGIDQGFDDRPGSGQPAALYTMKPKPKDEKLEEVSF